MEIKVAEHQKALNELILAGATDTDLFGRAWFPQTFRYPSPQYLVDIDKLLDAPENRYVSIMVFRDGAKTTRLRVFAAKRISYAISRNILFISKTQGHSIRSIGWLKARIERQTPWAKAFKLRKGGTWTTEEIEIIQGVEEVPVWIGAYGVTGQIRGINIDDWRPDLIILDDPLDEENSGTLEARNKIEDLLLGTVERTLVPASENPLSMIALLQTPLHTDDFVSKCSRDPKWVSAAYSCFDENGESRWPERYPTAELRAEKASYIARNKLSVWSREMEVKVIADELKYFDEKWLRYWDYLPDGTIAPLEVH